MANSPAKKKVGVLISGRGSNMEALIEASNRPDCPYEITLVFSNIEDAQGLKTAEEAGIKTAFLDHRGHGGRAAYDQKVLAILQEAKLDIVVLAGYMRIVTPEFVSAWEGRMLNIHPALLPSFTGLDTHKRALESGVRWHGCTVHFVTSELDAGPIITQAAVPVYEDDTEDSLAKRVLKEEHRIYAEALEDLAADRLILKDNRVFHKKG
ncbi:phosphoribosylglycinamide formyltransferase [Zymomonas mobilis]|uniref:phosphoribosylglycinamide formyltransferase n=1 Tax=Zymomonas mobilis TaxID=542 RepID=UPI0003C7579B|nr:phosphoribosylglycinamide formyltransferase [Zymomonas mobilis]AHB09900.1 formyltetrahydrofolate-dependent phosphoribosylglycinamide formyltransferase [Zymomonas mobilis subsp. mobilis str. CP4 = NRRL B-14023]AHJ70205.1 Phosphoribosylglycinamide formyltransferase [Zymomonas mobilis subsp. mobilis NRRL B-12526]AHJ72060.1 Phosphoribosylglycinamide formyltransferase [Zymomonas mobilis subsp. mobilis str. CP4 = NRRL B-14023]MCP9307364.1 phosphoribosylglycinamide formyltransferase [Zymomonas mobi